MTELLTSAQMRAIEAAAIASGKVTGLELMEAAGQGVVEAVFAEWPELAPAVGGDRGAVPDSPEIIKQDERQRRAVVLCGPGNNGGDGFVVARLLAELGWAVEVFLYGDAEKLPPDARVNHDQWREIGAIGSLTAECLSGCEKPDLLVDALFGTGLARPLPEVVREVFHWLLRFSPDWKVSDRKPARPIRTMAVSVDIASGVSADTGKPVPAPDADPEAEDDARDRDDAWPWFMTTSFHPDLTVTFHTPKVGHYIGLGGGEGPSPRVVPLPGLPMPMGYVAASSGDPETVRLIEPKLAGRPIPPGRLFPELEKQPGHKYDHGHVLVLCGPAGRGGAARLAARAALRVGAGLVTLGPPHAGLAENAAQLTAVMLTEVDDAATLGRVLQDDRLNALVLGPGLGVERARDLVPVVLEAQRAAVLDADALTAFAHDPATLFARLHDNCVLTPHAGEFARLFPDIAEALAKPATRGPAFSKVDATREAARRAGCTVLFKGADTVIADPSGCASVNSAAYERAAPWLATAGAGDVLAGIIAGLLARGFAPRQAAETAAWLHVEAARSFGPGLIAEDLPEELPKVFRDLGL